MTPLSAKPSAVGLGKGDEAECFNVTTLIDEVSGEVSCSSWNSTCSLWTAGTRGGHVHVFEKAGVPGTLSEMRAVASWQVSQHPISHLAWSPATAATQLAISCGQESASQPSTSASLRDDHIVDGEIGIWGPVSPLLEAPEDTRETANIPSRKEAESGQREIATWRRRAVLQVPSYVGNAEPDLSRGVLSLNFLQAESKDDPLLLLLAAVTSEGKLLVFSSRHTSCAHPQWSLRDQVLLVTEALVCPGQASLASAHVALHPSCDSVTGQRQRQPCVAVAVRRAGPQGSSEARVWAYSQRFLRWYPIADVAEALGPKEAAIHDIAWRPQAQGSQDDVIALGTSQGLRLLRLSNLPPVVGVLVTPTNELQVELVPLRLTRQREECWQVRWHWSGSMLAVVSGGGVIGVWKEDVGGVWVQQSVVEHGFQ